MALPILDGNQSATTLSTILSSGQHIPAHTVVSLGTQAITDMRGAVSGSVVSISNFPATQTIAGTVTANLGLNELSYVKANINITKTAVGTLVTNVFMRRIGQYKYQSISGWAGGEDEAYVEIELKQFEDDQLVWKASSFGGLSDIDAGEFAFANPQNAGGDNGNPFPPTAFTPMAGFTGTMTVSYEQPAIQPISGTVTIGSALPAGTNRIGVVTIGAGTVTIGAGTAQIGSVTASISGTVPISISSVTVGNSVTIGSLPAISGTVTATLVNAAQYDNGGDCIKMDLRSVRNTDSVTWLQEGGGDVPIFGTVTANTFAVQGTAVTTSNFTSTTASTLLAGYNATREVLTIFNEGAGNLHICAGATCTTIAYQVRLSAGDYYEVPNHQTTITHSAVFATAGTARVTEVS